MQSERWQRIEDIFHSALDCAPGQRPAFLDSACGGDTGLRREVESLLALNDSSGFTNASALEEGISSLERRNQKMTEGRRIGSYRVLREIGRGGMGNVYLAARADDEFQKLVAVKVIRRGLDNDEIIERFRSERQILATLDHPNITRLLDGGTTEDGLPYFVMEYIEGEPIDVYCDRHRLNITERLKLFQGVCAAVRYAHQNLVVHRDIKPGNVLVTKEGVPRLLDFGIAKLLASGANSNQTAATARLLTPEYASPEQVRGEPITIASDVYSLGVLLYVLLTGRRPYRQSMSSPAEIERSICEEEPERPSAAVLRQEAEPDAARQVAEGTPDKLRRRFEGDLDNIVLKALRKEPHRRYTSVEQFSEDINRHLGNLPVMARPDTRRYRITKFIQRNKAGVAAAALIFLILIAGLAAVSWQAHIARLEQAKAARINAFLQEMISYSAVTGSSANRKGRDATVADMLDDAVQRVETELKDQPEVRAEMLGTIGGAYMSLAKYDASLRYLQEAYDLDLKLYGPHSLQIAPVMNGFAGLAYLRGDYAAADSWFEKAVPIYRKHASDTGFELRFWVGILSDAAFAKRATGQPDKAEALWREALTYGPRLPAKYRAQVPNLKTFLAQLYVDRGDIQKADGLSGEAAQELRALGNEYFSLAQALIDLGTVRRFERRYAEADSLIQEGTNLYARAQGAGHPNVAFGLASLAMSHYAQGRYDLAEQDARTAAKIIEKLPHTSHYYAAVSSALGLTLNRTGRSREAEPLLREVLALRQKGGKPSTQLALAMGNLGECLATQMRYAEAEPLLVESYQMLDSVQVPQSPMLKEARGRLATFYAASGNPEKAASLEAPPKVQ